MRRKVVTSILLPLFLFASLGAPAANASDAASGLVTTAQYAASLDLDRKRADLHATLERQDVQDKLLALGVNPEDVQQRVLVMSDAEVLQMSEQMDEMPAGAGALELLVLLFLVFVILDIAGVTDVFPFISKA